MSDLTERDLTRLWGLMGGFYGTSWTREFGELCNESGELAPVAKTWLWALREEGVNAQRMLLGIRSCKKRERGFPPTLPEFVKLCTVNPLDVGLPDVETAFRQASSQIPDWDRYHPVIWHVRQACDPYRLINEPRERVWKSFESIYRQFAERVLVGEQFEIPVTNVPALPERIPGPPASRETARAALAEIRSKIRGVNGAVAAVGAQESVQ